MKTTSWISDPRKRLVFVALATAAVFLSALAAAELMRWILEGLL